ncbi:hypothetical protein Pan181_16890 [Aeoliella mucimassa]|uniref:Uncharacterized protein n=1 Tax=Aeoliella mucimassa TaxID=2527972 RepID=A0A518AL95_9BACT|nr:hypothetical protein Pan181_16890 [Aeoliella mucimassa]
MGYMMISDWSQLTYLLSCYSLFPNGHPVAKVAQ